MRTRNDLIIFYEMTIQNIADKKFHKILREYESGKLKSNGKKVVDEKQALVIAFSEARKRNKKYKPEKYANGKKIDDTTQLIFEQAYNEFAKTKTSDNYTFDEWMIFTKEGNRYFKRIAEIKRAEFVSNEREPIMNERGTKVSNNNEHRGGKLSGNYHTNGGIRAVIMETGKPVEVENEELITTRGVSQAEDIVTCHGKPEAIVSDLNVKYGGDKISDKIGSCRIKKYIMKKGSKIKNEKMEKGSKIKLYIDNKKIERMIIRENELKRADNGLKIDVDEQAAKELQEKNEYILITEPEVYAIMQFVDNMELHEYEKAVPRFIWRGNEICIYKYDQHLVDFLNKHGIHYKVYEHRDELMPYLKSLLPARIKDKIQ